MDEISSHYEQKNAESFLNLNNKMWKFELQIKWKYSNYEHKYKVVVSGAAEIFKGGYHFKPLYFFRYKDWFCE